MNEQKGLPIRKLPAARGLAWVSGSWKLVRRQPLRLLLIALFFQFFLGFSQAQLVGLIVILCLPVLSAGMLHAFYMAEMGERPLLAVLFLPFTARNSVGPLILLGAIVMAVGLLVVSLGLAGQMVDLDPEILSRIEQGDLEAVQLIDPQIIESAFIALAIGAAISGSITYFAVPLIWFRKQGVGASIVMGLRGLGRNWKPLLVLGLFMGIVAVPIGLLFASFYLSVLDGGVVSSLLAFLLLVLGPMFQLLLFGTQYMAFRDIFGLDESATGSGNKPDNQLVA